MKLNQLLVESPTLIKNIDDYPLYDVEHNRKKLNELSKLDLKLVKKLSEDTSLYTTAKRDRTAFAAINHKTNLITYYMEYEVTRHTAIGNFASQTIVWADPNDKDVRSLPKTVFFDYVLKKVGVIATDSLQTPKGKDFWLRRIKDALDRNLYVYYVNILTDKIEQVNDFSDVQKFNERYKIWTSLIASSERLFMISDFRII